MPRRESTSTETLAREPLDQPATSANRVVRGRNDELVALGSELDRVRAGVGAVMLLRGATGMGKSRLVAEAARIAERMSFRVGVGSAEPGEGPVELAPLMEALFYGGELPLLHGGTMRTRRSEPELRYWLLQDIQTMLERAALEHPLLICLDDMQWADGGTAAAMRVLPSRLSSLPIAWLIAFRPGQESRSLSNALEYLERNGAAKILLGPLNEAAVAEVAIDVMQAEPEQALLEMVARAKGNPFLLIELLSGLRDEQLVRIQAGHAQLIEDRLPRRVRHTVRERLGGTSDHAREAAIVAASLGRRFSFDALAKMLDLPLSALLSPVQELIDHSVLVESGARLTFQHDITRDAVRASVPVSVRRALDRQAADVLLAAGATPIEVATQVAASAEPGDEVAIATLLKASEELAMSDPGAAADLSRRGLDLAPHRHPLRGPLAAQTTLLLHEAARVEEAKVFADTLLREVLPAEQEAEVSLSVAGMFALSPTIRVDAGLKALALPDLPAGLRARHLASLAHNLTVAGRAEEALAILPDAWAATRSCGDGDAAFILKFVEGGLEGLAGRFGRALELTEAATRCGSASHDYAREHLTREWRCEMLMTLDRVEDSLALAVDGIAAAQRDRQSWALHIFETWRGRQLWQLGRLHDAAAILEGQLGSEHEEHRGSILDAAGVVALGRVALHLGDGRLQQRAAERARGMVEEVPPGFRRHGAWLLALQAMAAGDAPGARGWLCTLGEPERKSILPVFPPDPTDEIHLVRIALATHDHELAASAVVTVEERSRANPTVRTIAATAAHARGLLNDSEPDLERAAELFDDAPRPLGLASALEDLGAARLRHGGGDENAIDALNRALTLYRTAGASWDAARVRRRLRARGVRRRFASASPRAETGWAAMTDSELAVARLVARGHTNREVAEQLFVSPHTVNSHLRRIFAKLEVNSRVALTRIASDHDAPPR